MWFGWMLWVPRPSGFQAKAQANTICIVISFRSSAYPAGCRGISSNASWASGIFGSDFSIYYGFVKVFSEQKKNAPCGGAGNISVWRRYVHDETFSYPLDCLWACAARSAQASLRLSGIWLGKPEGFLAPEPPGGVTIFLSVVIVFFSSSNFGKFFLVEWSQCQLANHFTRKSERVGGI